MTSTDEPPANTDTADGESSRLILIVDDEAPIAEALALIVEDAGYRAATAFRGSEGLSLACDLRPAMLITDMMMPQLDGAALISALRREAQTERRALPVIIVMTAGGLAHAHAIAPDGVLQKPFSIADVEALLQRFLPLDPPLGEPG